MDAQRIMFTMSDGKCFPAELALVGQYGLLMDESATVFTDQIQTINMRIEVPGLFFVPKAVVNLISTSAVAGVCWMGSSGEFQVPWVKQSIKLFPRSGP